MTREAVIRQIVKRESQRLGLSEQAVLEDAPELHQAACEGFGTWITALEYAGVSLRGLDADNEYSPERVIQRIREHCRKGGNPAAMYMRRHNYRLYMAAKHQFGTWRQALIRAGLDLKRAGLTTAKPKRIDKLTVLDQLRKWQAAGHSLRWTDVCLQNRTLALAAKRAFGSWQRTLEAAGIVAEPKERRPRQTWDKRQIVEAIRKRQSEGKPMHHNGLKCDDCRLLAVATRHFGKWKAALAAAGIPCQD